MAVIPPVNIVSQHQVRVFRWPALANGDSGGYYELPKYSDKTVQFDGTFGAGGSVTLYGSNNPADKLLAPGDVGATWIVVTDPQANALTKSAAAIEGILENTLLLAPKVTAGDGTTAINITITAERTF